MLTSTRFLTRPICFVSIDDRSFDFPNYAIKRHVDTQGRTGNNSSSMHGSRLEWNRDNWNESDIIMNTSTFVASHVRVETAEAFAEVTSDFERQVRQPRPRP